MIPMLSNYLYNTFIGEMAELVYGARLESVLGRKALAGSNPVLSAKAKQSNQVNDCFTFLVTGLHD